MARIRRLDDDEFNYLASSISEMVLQRARIESNWIEAARYLLPNQLGMTYTKEEQGLVNTLIGFDDAPYRGLTTCAQGLMTGLTNPVLPWVKLSNNRPSNIMRVVEEQWLDLAVQKILDTLNQTNFYSQMQISYTHVSALGTAVMMRFPDEERLRRYETLPPLSYFLGLDDKNQYDKLVRAFTMAWGDVVKRFRLSLDEARTIGLGDLRDSPAAPVSITHAIYPNPGYVPGSISVRERRFVGEYFVSGVSRFSNTNAVLQTPLPGRYTIRTEGYDVFPASVLSWEPTPGFPYGAGPGNKAVGAFRELLRAKRSKGHYLDRNIIGTLALPAQYKQYERNLTIGGYVFYDEVNDQGQPPQVSNIYGSATSAIDINALLNDIETIRGRILSFFFQDVFLAISSLSNTTMRTKAEVDVRVQEKLNELGGVTGSINSDTLPPIISDIFFALMNSGQLAEPPESLLDAELQIEFTSLLSRAQATVKAGSINSFMQMAANVAALKPEALDKINSDALVDALAMATSSIQYVYSNEDADMIRQARQQQQQQQQELAEANLESETVNNLAQADRQSGDR